MVKMEIERGMKKVKYGEIAPLVRMSHHKYYYPNSNYYKLSKLETIIEEGADHYNHHHHHHVQVYPKRLLYLVPFFLTFLSYFLLYRVYTHSYY